MKLRYDFDTTQKSYRTFPQKVAHSTGLADRWSILRWCCPFCLEKPRSRSRKSSGVPVIRITRPRSPDSDPDSEDESEERRSASVGSSGGVRTQDTVKCHRVSKRDNDSTDLLSHDSNEGSEEFGVNEEENVLRGCDSDSIVSKESVRSKESVLSKSSVKSKSSITESVKSKSFGKAKISKDSRTKSKESFKNSHDSLRDKEAVKDKSRSSVRKIFKHLKRGSSAVTSPSGSVKGDKHTSPSGNVRGDKHTSVKHTSIKSSSVADSDKMDIAMAKTSTSRIRGGAHEQKTRKSMTLDGRGRGVETLVAAKSQVEGEGIGDRGSRWSTLDGRNSRRDVTEAADAATPEEKSGVSLYQSTVAWEVRKVKEEEEEVARTRDPRKGNCNEEMKDDRDSTNTAALEGEGEISTPTSPEDVMEEVTFKSREKLETETLERIKEKEEGMWQVRVAGVAGFKSCPPETLQKDKGDTSSSDHQYHLADNTTDESGVGMDDGVGRKSGSPSPLAGSMGRTSGRDSIASHHTSSSTDNSCLTHPDDDIERLLQLSEKKTNCLTPLGSRSESMASVCSAGAEGRYGTVIIKGEMELGLQYNYKEGQLECHILQCRDLAAVDTKRNRSDPYVKVYLLPDKSKSGKRKTKVKKHTLNPVFEEVLRFSTTMSDLESRTLWVSVWHSDMFGRNDFLGEVVISLADTVFDDVSPKWYPLQDRMEPMEDLSYSPRGDLILALKFVPPDAVTTKKARRSRGALHVLVKEAKSLAAAKPHGTADPVCKGLLLPEKGKASKQKTSVCRKTLNPTWNHTLMFEDTSLQELTERALELSVWDHDRLGPSQFLGGCRLSLGKGKHGGRPVEWMEAAGMEVRLWEQMLERPNLWVEGSIMLRPAMDKPIYSSSITE
nr:synaptotagmin-like protein 5 [Cherax quadricarinatus]